MFEKSHMPSRSIPLYLSSSKAFIKDLPNFFLGAGLFLILLAFEAFLLECRPYQSVFHEIAGQMFEFLPSKRQT